MKAQKPLFWHQGVLLQPQHFQLLDRSCQGLFTPYQKFIEPCFWGVGALNINKDALGTRSFKIHDGEFLFHDGTFVSLPDNALINTRVFNEAWVQAEKPFNVYLGLKKWNDTGENVTVLPTLDNIESVQTRFVGTNDFEEVHDLHAAGSATQAKKLHYVLKIFWETEEAELGDYELIKIAQLERFGAEVRLSGDFIPPCLSFRASESLNKLINEIKGQISARGNQLEEHKSKRGIQTAEFGSRDMVYFLALRSVNRYVPTLFHYTNSEQVHPWHFYGLLRQLIGELTSFSEQVSVLGELADGKKVIPDYDHENLWGCFSAAQNMISHLLDEITAGPEYILRLGYDGTYYSTELKSAMFEGKNRFYLAVKTEEDPKIVLQALEDLAKLSSIENMQTLVSMSLPGIKLEHLQVPPQELPRRANTIYFLIDHHNEQWESVSKKHNLSLFWNNAPIDVEIELMVVGR